MCLCNIFMTKMGKDQKGRFELWKIVFIFHNILLSLLFYICPDDGYLRIEISLRFLHCKFFCFPFELPLQF